ncbi:MAG: AI-2E family transporter [Patescibacteria group bacterium]|nr:AI-2E family transporter [Patescibacteria group bacterium]
MALPRGTEKHPFSITITPGTVVTTIVIGLLAWLLFYLRDLVLIVLTAIVLASAVEPGVQWFRRRGLHRVLSVGGVYIVVFGILFSVAYVFFPPLLQETRSFVASLPQFLDSINVANLVPGVSSVTPSTSTLTDAIYQLQSTFTSTGTGAFRALSGIFGGVISFILIVVLSFYFAIEETGVDDFLRFIVPVEYQSYAAHLWRRSHQKIGLWMQGQLILSLIMGVFAFLWLSILQIPFALMLAFVAALAELIPIFGPIMAGTAAVIVASSSEPTSTILLVAGGFIVLHELEANLIYPLVVKKVVGVPPLLVILALFAGGELAGFLGILLSVPIAAALQEFVTDVQKRKEEELAHLKEVS